VRVRAISLRCVSATLGGGLANTCSARLTFMIFLFVIVYFQSKTVRWRD
jgi:hypothetical protein